MKANKHRIARILRRNRVIEGFRNNEELVDSLHSEFGVLLNSTHLDEMERAERDVPAQILPVLAKYYKCSVDNLVNFRPVAARVPA